MKDKRRLKFRYLEDKMGTYSYRKQRNASIIAFSPAFKEAVKAVRSALGIPLKGFTREAANKWYKKHHEANTPARLRPLPNYYWHFPSQFVELLHSFGYSSEPSRVNFYRDVPLDRYAMELVHRFDLPEDVVNEVKASILLTRYGSLSSHSMTQFVLIPVNEGEEGIKYMALIAGIDTATTQKDWLAIWESVKAILRLSGMSSPPHKRPMDNLLLRDITFWQEIQEGRTAREVVDRWTKKHPEGAILSEDTVRKAVSRVDRIMHPSAKVAAAG